MIDIFYKLYLKYLKSRDQIKYAKKIGVVVGNHCRFFNVDFGNEPYIIKIGEHVSATDVKFITHDGGIWLFRDEYPEWDILKPITIGNNVYIGSSVTILPGTTIGNNIIIGACSVVKGILDSNAVYAGVPAKRIKSITEYKENIKSSVENTKSLNWNEKMKFYKEKYKNF